MNQKSQQRVWILFSDNAPALDAAIHRAFEDRNLNMVNARREFFRVSLDENKAVVKEIFDQPVGFIDVPAAEQYRQSELLQKTANKKRKRKW